MLIETIQNRDNIELSYVDNDNNISVETLKNPDGYFQYVICDENDVDRLNNLKSFKKLPLKKVPARYFKHQMLNEFIYNLDKINPDIAEKVKALRIPTLYSVDIEVIPTAEFGYSDQFKVENPITSISITDSNLNSIQFTTKNPDYPEISDIDLIAIKNGIKKEIKQEFLEKYDFNIAVRVFETEREMLETFFITINKYFHSITGWNFIEYDWTYISNRADKIGVDIKLASPKFKTKNKSILISKNNNTRINIKLPTHRIISDYMLMVSSSMLYSNLGSYSLDNISQMFLGMKKIEYSGNLRLLYKSDFLRFLTYGFFDTILVMLIHKKVGLYDVDFFESYLNHIPYSTISQNSISGALIFNELRKDNQIVVEEEFSTVPRRKYPGGYVKKPIRKKAESTIGIDYSALYPFTIITNGISIERFVDKIEMNDDYKPATNVDEEKWLFYKKQNCILAPTGRIYSKLNDEGEVEHGLYPRIELQKQKERGIFKSIKKELYLDILTKIDEKIKTLKNNNYDN